METKQLQKKIKIHDGIVGLIYLISIVLGVMVNLQWLYLAGVVAVLQISSAFTGFCPVYYGINKLMPDDKATVAGPTS